MSINKATPRAILNGIRDDSGRIVAAEAEQLPQSLPHLFLLTERGPTTPQLIGYGGIGAIFGTKTLDLASAYANHQTVLAKTFLDNSNQVFIQRLKPENAETALLRISVEVITRTINVYARNSAGLIEYTIDAAGNQVPVVEDTTIGHSLIWHIGTDKYTDVSSRKFGKGLARELRSGEVVGIDGVTKLGEIDNLGSKVYSTSKLYPILDLEVADFGSYGNLLGMIFDAPTIASTSPTDASLLEAVKAFLYRVRLVKRDESNTTYVINKTTGGDVEVQFTLKDNVIHPYTNKPLGFEDTFIDKYQTIGIAGYPDSVGPFSKTKLYTNYYEEVLNRLVKSGTDPVTGLDYLGEEEYDDVAMTYGRNYGFAEPEHLYMLNIFTGKDYNDVPYFSFTVEYSENFEGTSFGYNEPVYATGGDDGLIYANGRPDRLANLKIYDDLVATELLNYGDLEAPMLDSAKYPVSSIWDSGFSMNTKKKCFIPMSLRKDIYTIVSTQAVADMWGSTWKYMPANDMDTEINNANTLLNTALLSPESVIHGTPVCRAVIIGRCGKLRNKVWNGILPLTIDFADKVSKYMGAADGKWKSRWAMDKGTNNQLSKFYDVNLTYMNNLTADNNWDAGIVWVQNYDRTRLFYPAYQTVYGDDTSVLNSFITMAACVQLERVAQQTWRDLSGKSLTNEQLITESNKLINRRIDGIFDNRFTIEPNTYLTEADNQRGYSWSCEITIKAGTMRTVGTFTVIAQRLDEE